MNSTDMLRKAAEKVMGHFENKLTNGELIEESGFDLEAWRILSTSCVMSIAESRDQTIEDLSPDTIEVILDALLTGAAIGVAYEKEVQGDIDKLFGEI